MNDDPDYMRAALRTEGIPALERAVGRSVRASLARTARLLREDADFLQGLADAAERDVVVPDGEGSLIRANAAAALPPAVAQRVVRRVLFGQGVVPELRHVEAVLHLLDSPPGTRAELPGGLKAKRERGYVRLSRSSPRSDQDDPGPPASPPLTKGETR
jgi:tRNA(Ile)-lysidine synthase